MAFYVGVPVISWQAALTRHPLPLALGHAMKARARPEPGSKRLQARPMNHTIPNEIPSESQLNPTALFMEKLQYFAVFNTTLQGLKKHPLKQHSLHFLDSLAQPFLSRRSEQVHKLLSCTYGTNT